MPTLREIAASAGVSLSTVSLVLNNKHGVSEEMRQRVLAAVRELEQRDPPIIKKRRAIRRHKDAPVPARSVLVLHPSTMIASAYFASLLKGLQTGADKHNLQLRLAHSVPNLPPEHISNLYFSNPDLHPDGVISLGMPQFVTVNQAAEQLGIPIVLVGEWDGQMPVSVVAPDEIEAGEKVGRYLGEYGHRRIAFVFRGFHSPDVSLRLQGIRRGLAEYGAVLQETDTLVGMFDAHTLELERLIARLGNFTALILGTHGTCQMLLPLIEGAGYKIPTDLSVVAFDDTEFERRYSPPLTTIAYPVPTLGERAIQLLIDHLNHPEIKYIHVLFSGELVERESVHQFKQNIPER